MVAGSWIGTTESTGAMAEADDGEDGVVGAAVGAVAPAPVVIGDEPGIPGVTVAAGTDAGTVAL